MHIRLNLSPVSNIINLQFENLQFENGNIPFLLGKL